MPRTLECFRSRKYRDIQLFSRGHQLPLTWALLSLQPLSLQETMSKSNPYGYNYRIYTIILYKLMSYICNKSTLQKSTEITTAKELHLELYQSGRL